MSSPANALRRALRNVKKERSLAAEELAPKRIHDLRVVLRRCRSLAEGFSELNPNPEWRHLRKICKELLEGLAPLRDTQVMHDWVRRLGFQKGTAGAELARSLEHDRRKGLRTARHALKEFPRKRWKRWRDRLPKRAERITISEAHFARLALQRLRRARELEQHWRTTGSRQAAHHFRIGLKRFRYTMDSFLPSLVAWGADLKLLQGFLGDVHDLDVLRARVLPIVRGKGAGSKVREQWLAKIEKERDKAVESYWEAIALKPAVRARATGRPSRTLWDRWESRLRDLAGVISLVSAEPSPSTAKPASRGARRNFRYPGRQLRTSAAQ